MKSFLLIAVPALFLSLTASAQLSYKIASKANCSSLVEVEFYNPSTTPGTYTTTVALAPVDLVYVSAPDNDPGWMVCSVGVLTGGGFLVHPLNVGVCFGAPSETGDISNCISDFQSSPSGFYYWYE